MVTIAVTSESADEPRVAVSPDTVKKFTALGAKVRVESGAGLRSRFSDEAYRAAGAEIVGRGRRRCAAPIFFSRFAGRVIEEVAALEARRHRRRHDRPLRRSCGARRRSPEPAPRVFSMEFMPRIDARAVDGRAVEPGEPRRLQGRHRWRGDVRAGAADDDDAGRHGSGGEGLHHGRRRSGPAGDRDGAASRRAGDRDRRAPRDEGAGAVARRQVHRGRG